MQQIPPKKKMPRPPPGPPDWKEGPQLPTKEQREQLEKELQEEKGQLREERVSATDTGEWQNYDEDIQQQLRSLQAQGISEVTWQIADIPQSIVDVMIAQNQTPPVPCPLCSDNDGVTVRVGEETFPSGHFIPPAHPNCRCTLSSAQR